jgi:hypothetical protein
LKAIATFSTNRQGFQAAKKITIGYHGRVSRVLLITLAAVLAAGLCFAAGRLLLQVPCPDPAGEKSEIDRLKKQVQKLKTKAFMLETLADSFQEYKKDPPIPWPEGIPKQYRPEQFRSIVAQGLEEIQAPVDLVGFECVESPCIAMMRIHEGYISKINNSNIWRENFGKGVTGSPVMVDCPDGSEERIELVAAEWNMRHDPKKMSPEAYKQAMQKETHRLIRGRLTKEEAERGKRLSLRMRRLRIFWECAK